MTDKTDDSAGFDPHPLLPRLVDGTLTEAERAELQAAAATHPEVALALEGYTPLEDIHDDVLSMALEAFPEKATAPVSPSAEPSPPPANNLRGYLGPLLAVAVAALVALWPVQPTYDLEVGGRTRIERSEGALPHGLHPERSLLLSFRPDSPTSSRATLTATLERDGTTQELVVSPTWFDNGFVELNLSASELGGIGHATVIVDLGGQRFTERIEIAP